MSKLTLVDIKQALKDERFRELFPEYKVDIDKFLEKPNCGCTGIIYKQVMQHPDRLKTYFPNKEVDTTISAPKIQTNIKVINCHVDELEEHLKKNKTRYKQIAIGRWQDQVTVVIEEFL